MKTLVSCFAYLNNFQELFQTFKSDHLESYSLRMLKEINLAQIKLIINR